MFVIEDLNKESAQIWKKLGISEDKIKKCGRQDNFWGPTGDEGPCGPTTEIYFGNVEVWNLVFNEYYQDKNKNLTKLSQKGVDTGMGLERLAMIVQEKPSVFETDLFWPIMKEISGQNERAKRIISDHVKGAVFLISEGILPSKVGRGSVLRNILRRAIEYGRILNLPNDFLIPLVQRAVEIYKDVYPKLKFQETEISTVVQNEEEEFEKSEPKREKVAMKIILEKKIDGKVTGEMLYDIFGTTRVGPDRLEQLAKEHDIEITDLKEGLKKGKRKHQEISRAGVEKKFGGVGKEATYTATKLHTATHLLHAALREILGKHVKQMGSDITSQRLRFDFSYHQKMTNEEIKKVEDLVNQKIKEDLEVKKTEVPYQEALKSGALAFFKEKYPEKVNVYSIDSFSKEICAGPHIKKTSELGQFKIIKEESSGAGIRRIRAILE